MIKQFIKYDHYYNAGKMIYDVLAFVAKPGKSVYDKLHKKYSYYMLRKHIMAVNERYGIHK